MTCRRLAAQITGWRVGVRVKEGGAHIVLELNCVYVIEAVIGKRKYKDLNKCRKLQFVMIHLSLAFTSGCQMIFAVPSNS